MAREGEAELLRRGMLVERGPGAEERKGGGVAEVIGGWMELGLGLVEG
jgi:hypothetical protein